MRLFYFVPVSLCLASLVVSLPQNQDFGSGPDRGSIENNYNNKQQQKIRNKLPPLPYGGYHQHFGPFPQGPPPNRGPPPNLGPPGLRISPANIEPKPNLGPPGLRRPPPKNPGPPPNLGPLDLRRPDFPGPPNNRELPDYRRPPDNIGLPDNLGPPNSEGPQIRGSSNDVFIKGPPALFEDRNQYPEKQSENPSKDDLSSNDPLKQANFQEPGIPDKIHEVPIQINNTNNSNINQVIGSVFDRATSDEQKQIAKDAVTKLQVTTTTRKTNLFSDQAGVGFADENSKQDNNNFRGQLMTPAYFQFIPVTPQS